MSTAGILLVLSIATIVLGCTSTSTSRSAKQGKEPVVAANAAKQADGQSLFFTGERHPLVVPLVDSDGAVLAESKTTRQIKMIYRVNLFRHNMHARRVVDAMKPHEPRLRACYTDRLEAKPSLSGELSFYFLLSKEGGSLQAVKRIGGSIDDKPMVDCLVAALRTLSLPAPQTMKGRVDYVFNVLGQRQATLSR